MDQRRLYSLYESDPTPIVNFLLHVQESYGLPEGLAFLDVGCGPGRMLRPLTALGWQVTGMEPDSDYVDAVVHLAQQLPGARARRGGFADIDERNEYDFISAINGPLCYLLDVAERRDAIHRCYQALKPGGVLCLDQSNFWWILRNYREPPALSFEVDGTEVVRTARHTFDLHRGVLTHADTFTYDSGGQHSVTKTISMAMVGYPEIELFLRESGFGSICSYDSYDAREPRPATGKRLLVTARKPHDR